MTLVAPAQLARRRGATWVLARVGGTLIVLWAAATVSFFALRAIPGDPALALLGGPGSQASAEALARVREQYGFDHGLFVQYLLQLRHYALGQLGESASLHQSVASAIAAQLGPTLVLTVAALAAAWLFAFGLAVWSAWGGRVADAVGSGVEVVAAAVPHFWLGAVLILVFSSTLGVLPAVSIPGWLGLVLPTATLALPLAGFLAQIMRESMADAVASPFALSARARGESRIGLIVRHALRHAALPAIGLSGWAFGSLISGAVVVEVVFARQGLGRTLLHAVQDRDVLLVSGVVLVVALAYCIATALSDLLEVVVDPRLRRSRA